MERKVTNIQETLSKMDAKFSGKLNLSYDSRISDSAISQEGYENVKEITEES